MIAAAGASLVLALHLANAQEAAKRQVTYTEIVVEAPFVVQDEEVELLARLIYAEGNTLGETGMAYIGSVALNRVASEHFPDTLEEVVYQAGQYACTWNGAINTEPSDVAYEIAEELLIYGSQLPGSVVWQSEFIQGSGVYTTVGNTYFCY